MRENRLLIVEDESIVAMDIERRLKKLGYGVVATVPDGASALRVVADKLPDLILMDIRIKGSLDGIDVADQVQKDYSIPVIFLTAFSEDSTLDRACETKPYGYLLKPFSDRDLHATIQVALERFHHDVELIKSESHLRLALDTAQLGTWELNHPQEPVMFGYMPSGDLERIHDWESFGKTIVASDRDRVEAQIDLLRKKHDTHVEIEFEVEDADGGRRCMALFGKTYLTGEQVYRAVGVLQDVTERHDIESRLKQAAMVYQCSADGIVILDAEKKVISANKAFYRISGFSPEEVEGKAFHYMEPQQLGSDLHADLCRGLQQEGRWQGEVRGYCKNGNVIHAWLNIAGVPRSPNSGAERYVLILSDITAVHDAQEKITQFAYYDTLTNLPNRNLFIDRLDHALAKCRRDGMQLAVLFIDLDHFKRVNDTLGHQVGDSMLRAVAHRLRSQLRETDTLCRIGGDEFIVIMEAINSPGDAEVLSKKLLSALDKPLQLGVHEVIPSGSIGISFYPQDSTSRDDLIRMADTAMYAAKSGGRKSYAFYRSEMTEHTARYLSRERELRKALNENQFVLFYQPQININSKALVGLEALIRWQHPEKGLVSANEIIPVAEESALIVDIGEWVIETACRQLRDWLDGGFKPPRMALNTSVRQLKAKNFIVFVHSCLKRYNISGEYIELEVTESCLQETDIVVPTLIELQKSGVAVSIDDFGTGYSCMSSLKFLPIQKLKIDQSFVRDIPDDDNDCAIAAAIVALGKQLKLTVIAEGIETETQAEFMRDFGCDELQGYLYGYPQPAPQLENLLSRR